MTPGSAAAAEEHIPLSQLTAFGAGGIIPIALFNSVGVLVGLMGNISLGLSAFWLGVILIVPRVWDAVADPVIGHWSDNTRTRWGRRRPFLLLGGLLVAVFFVVIWWIPKAATVVGWFPSEASYKWFQLGYILVTLTMFFTSVTLFEIPHGALGMEMSTDSHQRTRLFSAKSFVGNLFAMSTPWLLVLANLEVFKGPRGNEADGMRYVSMLVAALLVPLSFWWFFALREPGFEIAAAHEPTPFWPNMKRTVRNRNFMMLTLTVFTLSMGFNFVQLLGSYIPIYYVFSGDKSAGAWILGINGTVWAITGLLAVFPLDWLSPRLGKRSMLLIAIALISLGQLAKIVCYNRAHPYLTVIPTVPLSIGMLFFFTLGQSMVGDICDEDELASGTRSEGSFYAVFWWFIKAGTAVASLISGALIMLTLFDEAQVTKVDQLQGGVRDMRGMVDTLSGADRLGETELSPVEAAKKQFADAMQETQDFVADLQSQSVIVAGETAEAKERREAIIPTLYAMKGVSTELSRYKGRVDSLQPDADTARVDVLTREIVQLRMRAKLELTRVHAVELHAYLKDKSETAEKDRVHYRDLTRANEGIERQLGRLSEAKPPKQVKADLEKVGKSINVLNNQAPYTLFMMRVVEIGLPLIASILSLLFLLRYGLTEQRSREIKEQLSRRHAEKGAGAKTNLQPGPTP